VIPGDIYIRVQIKKHKTFIRKGADLAIIKNISLLEALTGITLELEHLDGKKFTLATAPG
jgi:DnaJ-class molecular chaperone